MSTTILRDSGLELGQVVRGVNAVWQTCCVIVFLAALSGCDDAVPAAEFRLDLFEQEPAAEATRARALLAVVSVRPGADAGLDAGMAEVSELRLVIDSRDALLCTTGIVSSELDAGAAGPGTRDAGLDAGSADGGSDGGESAADGGPPAGGAPDAGTSADVAGCRRQVVYPIRSGVAQQRFVTIVLANDGIDTPLVVGSIVDETGQILVSVPRRLGLTEPSALDAGGGSDASDADGGAGDDAGVADDAGAPDGGAGSDAGTTTDGGSATDAGSDSDAGPSTDAG